MKKVRTGGGWPALVYTLRKAREAGGFWKLWKAMRSKNACKTCALGMGGQLGGPRSASWQRSLQKGRHSGSTGWRRQ